MFATTSVTPTNGLVMLLTDGIMDAAEGAARVSGCARSPPAVIRNCEMIQSAAVPSALVPVTDTV
ncbi:hypothetical protein CLE01_25120 [Cryobacterium levicorallinum]|nr:hypothetical protein CLE01_25120 [Cryobacterium levicorallinum]